jgi:hypothetical protein
VKRASTAGSGAALVEPFERGAAAAQGPHLLTHRPLLAPAAAHQAIQLPLGRGSLPRGLLAPLPLSAVASHQHQRQQGGGHQARSSSVPHR